jgi:DNA-binding PadR family transcriptional regulator
VLAKDLLLLALIRRGAISGYALRRAMRSHAVLYAEFDHGNVLYRLRRMQDEGLIEARVESGASGPRRERALYAITPHGEQRYAELLARAFAFDGPGSVAIEVALALIDDEPPEVIAAHLKQRLDGVARYERTMHRLFRGARGGGLNAAHLRSMLEAERRWIDDTLIELRKRAH